MTALPTALPILIVDDDEPTQKLLQAVLRRSGYESEVAADGEAAISLLRDRAFSAVVLDVMMPTVGGREVVAFMVAERSAVPVVICSAAGPSALTDFPPEVVKAVVRKPFDVSEFMNIVNDVVRA